MAEIRPFRGVRYQAQAGPPGPLLAPPYDVATADGLLSPFSIARIENVDLGVAGDQHAEAALTFQQWLRNGILARDATPAIYIHRHTFPAGNAWLTRTGIIALVRLHHWREGIVAPHEGTNPGPRAERLARLQAVHANLSPLYFLFRDHVPVIAQTVAEAHETMLFEEHDLVGGTHQLSAITDPATIAQLERLFADQTLLVADGHHRYEAALAFREQQRARRQGSAGPWDYVMALLAADSDPGVVIRPTHRLVSGSSDQAASFLALLRRWFHVEAAHEIDAELHCRPEILFQVMLGPTGDIWDVSALPGEPHRALLRADRTATWQDLPVAIVDGVLQAFLGRSDSLATSWGVPVVEQSVAEARVRSGEALAACFVPRPEVATILHVAKSGELMPAKSTWFEPKAPAGLVINDLGDAE